MLRAWGHCVRKLAPRHFIALNLALGLGHFVTVLSAGAYLPMLPYVAGSLGEALAHAVWGQSNYFTAMGAAFLITRPLTRRHGPRRMAIAAYLLFALAALGVLLSWRSFVLITVARTVQGFAAGLSITPALSLLLEHYRPARQTVGLSLWGLALFMPFSVGPLLGGWCAYVLGDWRWLFVGSALATLLVAGMIWALTGARPAPGRNQSVTEPLLLFGLFSGAALALQQFFNVGLANALTSGGARLQPLAALAAILALMFVMMNASARHPLIRPALFKHRDYALGLVILCLAFVGLQSSIVQTLIRLQTIDGYTAWHAGLLFLPLLVTSKPCNLLAQSWLKGERDPRVVACLALLGLAASFYWMGQIARPAPWLTLLWPQFGEGAALGLLFISLNGIALRHVPGEEQLHALDVLNTSRNLAAGLAITWSDIGWDHLLAGHRGFLTAADSGNAQRYLDTIAASAAPASGTLGRLLNTTLAHQAGWLNLNTLFNSLALLFLSLIALVWLSRADHPTHRRSSLERVVSTLGEEP
jgi:DHA2 family multidrug resistance protein